VQKASREIGRIFKLCLYIYENIKLVKLLKVLIIISLPIIGLSQSHIYEHYTLENGLPSAEVYSAFQDSKGYMWFATDAGVSRFNGYEFENFNVSDGLTDNTVFLITEDKKGRIWFGTFNLKLCYYENDSIYPYKYNKELKELNFGRKVIIDFRVDENGSVWISLLGEGIFYCDSLGLVKKIDKTKVKNSEINIVNTKKFMIWGVNFQDENLQLDKKDSFLTKTIVNIRDNKNIQYDTLSYNYKHTSIGNVLINKYGNRLLVYLGEDRFFLKKGRNEKFEYLFIPNSIKRSRVFSIYVENENIWFSTDTKGVFRTKIKNDSIEIVDNFLMNKSVSRTFCDNNGDYWFQTLNDGVYYYRNGNFKIINEFEGEGVKAITIDTVRNNLYLALTNKKVVRFNKGDLSVKGIVNSTLSIINLKYDYDKKFLYVDGSKMNLSKYNSKKIFYDNLSRFNIGAKSIIIDKDTIYKVNAFGFSKIVNDSEVFFSYIQGKSKMWCTSLIKNGASIWIGTNDGIRVYENDQIINPYGKHKVLSSAITSMERLTKDVFLIGTKSYGVLVIKNDTVFDIINENTGLASDIVRKIHIDNQKDIWIITNKGLSKLEYRDSGLYTIQNLDKKYGLPITTINDICSYQNTIFLATNRGLIEFDKTKLTVNTVPPFVFITHFNVNSKERKIKKEMELSYQENFINIYFEGLNYRSLGDIEYQYRMLGVDSNWITTTSRNIQYPTLQPNDYIFEVKAKNEDETWSEPVMLSFTITPPFWLTWWFIITEIIFGVIVIFLIFTYREKQLVKKNKAARKITEVEKKMVQLEMKALRSQMNPHFIFNTLNSIQHYVVVNDFRSTNKYIAQFAQLIRTVLNLSEKSTSTIREEIDMLTLYLDLEKMRFEKQFDYVINVNNKIDVDYDEIPSMLIQPYVENALWHGLMNKNEKGKITIDLDKKEEYLFCTIEDNGIGRKKAGEIKAERRMKQKSVGMSITKERLGIISNNDSNVKVLDLKNNEGNAMGTKVIIKIPYNI